ncbi:MAG: hypothetical protein LBM93_01480 [Oscillospiraceae bacterium]|jgi:pyruvate,water dikinase|nr:hypothetical protein [Oscillospiraceae bacterium]
MAYLLDFSSILTSGQEFVGNKAYNLAFLKDNLIDLSIPKSAVIPADIDVYDNNILEQIVIEISTQFEFPIILRSSTTVEDSKNSFAGLFESSICRDSKDLIDCIHFIRNSATTEQIESYCKMVGVNFNSIKTAILVQEYQSADMSGVLFTKNPITNDESVVYTEYKENTSDAVTAGSQIPKSLTIDKKKTDNISFPFSELVSFAIKAELLFGYPLDMEWILSNNKLWFVQVRRITT